MIIEFLDVKKRVIGTYTDKMVDENVQRRELVDRFIQDSVTLSVDLSLKDVVEEAKYFMVTDGQKFRVSPIYQKDQVFIKNGNSLEVDAKSESLDRAKEVNLTMVSGGNLLEIINEGSSKIGFEIELKTEMSHEDLVDGVFSFIETEFTLDEAITAILQVIDGYAEFDTILKDNYVDKTVLRMGDSLGKEYRDALIYGVNVEKFESTQRVEGIVTAIEYTGREIELSDRSTYVLTLERADNTVPREYRLPKTNRVARLTDFVDDGGNTKYLLEDVESTRRYGRYTSVADRDAEPIIETFSNTDVPTLEDLVELSIKELDGKNIPQTQYSVTAKVSGLDVGDNLGIQVPHLGINMTLPVLTIEYGLKGDGVCDIKVGEHLPTELDRRFENLPTSSGEGSREFGDVLSTVVNPRTVVYTSWENLLIDRYSDVGNKVGWTQVLGEDLYPELYEYVVSFDFEIHKGCKAIRAEFGMSDNPSDVGFGATEASDLSGNGYITRFGTKVAESDLDGSSGNLKLSLNDFRNFMRADENEDKYGVRAERRSEDGLLVIHKDNHIIPVITVESSNGLEFTLNYKDYLMFTPIDKVGLDETSGYLKNFKITKNELVDGGVELWKIMM